MVSRDLMIKRERIKTTELLDHQALQTPLINHLTFVESHMLTSYAFVSPIFAFFIFKDSLLGHVKHQATLTASQINEFTPFTHYASTAYCDPDTTADWTCGGKISLMVTCIILI